MRLVSGFIKGQRIQRLGDNKTKEESCLPKICFEWKTWGRVANPERDVVNGVAEDLRAMAVKD